MQIYGDSPNFSVVLPGGCNAACAFCFNRALPKVKPSGTRKFTDALRDALRDIPAPFRQISITGGEPLSSPALDDVLDVIRVHRARYRHVVLTTNGTRLEAAAKQLHGAVDHVNVSRHHYDARENRRVFGGDYYSDDLELAGSIEACSKVGIDVSLACVIDDSTSRDFVDAYLAWSKGFGVAAVNFRKAAGNLDPTPVEASFADHAVIGSSSCPVCRTSMQLIRGVRVNWKASAVEPSDTIDGVYELVFNVDAKLYRDWSMRERVDISDLVARTPIAHSVPPIPPPIPYRMMTSLYDQSSDSFSSGCGGPSYTAPGCGHTGGWAWPTRGC